MATRGLSSAPRDQDYTAVFDAIFEATTIEDLHTVSQVNGVFIDDADVTFTFTDLFFANGGVEEDLPSLVDYLGAYAFTLPDPALNHSDKSGMIRFIHHHSTLDPTEISDWVRVLLRLVHEAEKMTKDDIFDVAANEALGTEFAHRLGIKLV